MCLMELLLAFASDLLDHLSLDHSCNRGTLVATALVIFTTNVEKAKIVKPLVAEETLFS